VEDRFPDDDFYASYFGISDEELDEWYKESEEFVEV
jgi:hypothetical protein